MVSRFHAPPGPLSHRSGVSGDGLRLRVLRVKGAHPDQRFLVALLPHGATNICVRQLQALLNPGQRIAEELIDVWPGQPDQEQIWVPHLGWAHTLIAPLSEPRPAPNPGGREQAAPQLKAVALNIPPHNGLAAWESWTAQERGHNRRAMVECYAQRTGLEAHAEPRRHSTPTTVAMVVLENGNYNQMRITTRPLARRWDLEAVDYMIPRETDLPHGPSPLGQPPDPLTTIVSGRAGTWHEEDAVYCL